MIREINAIGIAASVTVSTGLPKRDESGRCEKLDALVAELLLLHEEDDEEGNHLHARAEAESSECSKVRARTT